MIFISTNVKHVNTEKKKSDMLTCNSTEISNNPWNKKVIVIFRIYWMTPSGRARCQHIHGARAFCKASSCTWVNFLACCPDGLRDPPRTPRNSFLAPSCINLFLHHHVEKKIMLRGVVWKTVTFCPSVLASKLFCEVQRETLL